MSEYTELAQLFSPKQEVEMASLALCSNNKLHFTIVGSVTGAMPG